MTTSKTKSVSAINSAVFNVSRLVGRRDGSLNSAPPRGTKRDGHRSNCLGNRLKGVKLTSAVVRMPKGVEVVVRPTEVVRVQAAGFSRLLTVEFSVVVSV